MRALILSIALMLSATGAKGAPNCWVPRFRTLYGQTVDATMIVRSGRRCSIIMRTSSGATYSATVLARPAHGEVHVEEAHRIVYRPRRGYSGSDTFTYARRGLDLRNNASARTVRVQVTVTP
jgi:hypothetical protein